jgi:phosphoglycerate dehydrogenase-like enzyme
VTEPEPLPAGDPLWDAPNLIVTPHIAGYGGAVPAQRLGGLLQRNLDAFLNGRPHEAQITLRPHASAQPAAAATLLSPQQ